MSVILDQPRGGGNIDLNNPPKQLIKKEWDLIEAWLAKHVKDTDQ